MAYDLIRPAAFIPDPDAEPLQATYHTLAFPRVWREAILDFYRQVKKNEKIKQVPIRRLNTTIAALVPDWVSVATHATVDDAMPWLYTARGPFPKPVMDTLLMAWLSSLQPSAEAYPVLRDTMQKLAEKELQWDHVAVDLLECTVSDGGTALPAQHLYRLLPDVIAGRIEQLPPYEYCGTQVSFRRVATSVYDSSAELMSWPPLEHPPKSKKDDKRTWKYSGTIKIALRTVPFSSIPRIYISTGIRRWVRGQVWMPQGRGVSVYLLADSPLLDGAPTPARFAMGKLVWDADARKTAWAEGGPEQMLGRLSATRNFPLPEVLVKEPERWISGYDGITAAVVHHTMMGSHGVKPGIMPSERRRLVEWAAQALEPQFKWSGELRRSSLPGVPGKVLEKPKPIKKKATDEERAIVAAENQEIALRNAARRRPRLGDAVSERCLTAYVLYQTDHMLQNLVSAAEESLGLTDFRVETGPATWYWHAPEVGVRIHARPLGALGGPIGGDKAPRRGKELDQAIRARRAEVRDYLARLSQELPGAAQIAFVELHGQDTFKPRTTDPKFAIRLGCADADLVSQFLRPRDPEVDEDKDDSRYRAEAAWADGLRQVGMRFVPEHSLGDAIPERLNQVAFWLVKRRTDGPTGHPQFTPIAILIRPDQKCVMGRSPETAEWVPYPELLKGLTRDLRDDQLATKEQQETATAAFIKQTLYKLRTEPTLVVTHAQNIRSRWPWLQNGGLVKDKIKIGGGPLQRLAAQGRYLRIARVATSQRSETPEWWVQKEPDHAGLAKGLWVPEGSDPDNRIFYSTTEKSSSHTISVDATKLTPHINVKTNKPETNAGKNAWNPDLLEFAMVGLQEPREAEVWAMFLHQQRFSDDYRDGLRLPLILHLAALTSAYALPQEEVEQVDTDTEHDTDPTSEQLELDLGDLFEGPAGL